MKAGAATRVVILCAFGVRFTAAADCASCHAAEVTAHSQTRMAHALLPALDSGFGQNLPDRPLSESPDGFRIEYTRGPQDVIVTARRGTEHAQGVIEWVAGAGAQGETPLIQSDGAVFESRVSYFPGLQRFGITVGQDAGASPNAVAALGSRRNARDLHECIACHATNVSSDSRSFTPGVQCERCHYGAAEHAAGGPKPYNPGRTSAREQVVFCGACHRVKPPVSDTSLENVRFQPLRLMKSRCFTSGTLACTTCHPAHRDAIRDNAAFYRERCESCHANGFHADARRNGDCAGCHMPRLQLHPALRFTDHFIRVVRAEELSAAVLAAGRLVR